MPRNAIGRPGAEVLFKVLCPARKALAKVKKNAGIVVGQQDLVAAYFIHSAIELDVRRQALIRDGW